MPCAGPVSEPRFAVSLAPGVVETLVGALVAARGVEPCGYLLGRRRRDGVEVCAYLAGTNVHRAPHRAFALAPREQLAARRRARASGWGVVGFGHGHPAGAARPSGADVRGLGLGAPPWMLIAGHERAGAVSVRAWHVVDGRAVEARTIRARV